MSHSPMCVADSSPWERGRPVRNPWPQSTWSGPPFQGGRDARAPRVAELRQQLMSNLSGHIGQPEITALEPKGQLGVVDP